MARDVSAKSSRRRSREARAVAEATSRSRWQVAGWAALLAAITLAGFAPSLANDFVSFDDVDAIIQQADYNPPALAKFGHYWTEPFPNLYTPMLWTVWGFIAFVARSEGPHGVQWDAFPFHAFNLAAHVGAAVMALLVLRRLVRSDRAAFVGAALFALHPLQVEAVAWVSGMKTPLSGLFALWSIWHFLRFSELRSNATGTDDASAAGRPWLHYGLATFAFVLAMITKPTVIVLPAIVGAIEVLLRGRRVRDVVLPLAPWLLAALLLGLWNAESQINDTVFIPAAWQRALIGLGSLSFYLWKLLLPLPLLPDYGLTPESVVGTPWLWLGALPAAVVLALAALTWRRVPWLAVAVVTFALGAVTTIGLIPYEYQIYSTVADRYAYLSLFGAALAVAYLVRGRGARTLKVSAGVLVACAVLTFVQCMRWADTATLFNYTLRHNPRSLIAFRSLAYDSNEHGRSDEVAEFSRRGLEVRPGDTILLQWTGNMAMQRGRFDEAAAAFRESVKTSGPRRPENLNSLGAALAQSGKLPEAEAAFQQSVAENPKFAPAYENLGILNAQRNQWDDAVRYLSRALEIDPTSRRAKALLPQIRAHLLATPTTKPTATTAPSTAPAANVRP